MEASGLHRWPVATGHFSDGEAARKRSCSTPIVKLRALEVHPSSRRALGEGQRARGGELVERVNGWQTEVSGSLLGVHPEVVVGCVVRPLDAKPTSDGVGQRRHGSRIERHRDRQIGAHARPPRFRLPSNAGPPATTPHPLSRQPPSHRYRPTTVRSWAAPVMPVAPASGCQKCHPAYVL